MNRLLAVALGLLFSVSSVDAQKYVPTAENLQSRKEFSDARFGIFLHWGLYSMFAQGEWYMQNAGINAKEYAKSAQAFYPHRFDAQQWISAFKKAGAKYICFTTRHHDGFSMWNTQQSDYNIMNTPYGKDIVGQLADECHRQNMRLHLYYSHIDWTREDYPAGRTGRGCKRLDRADWKSYYKFMNNQLTELLTNYGKVDAIWFDGMWDHEKDSVPFDWQLENQYRLIHSLQPACLIGNNHHAAPFDGEDIQLFERDVPGENKAGLSGQDIAHLPLETCQTMNGMWGYKIVDQNYKSATELIQLLVRTSGKGANLLLNIGPHPDGTLPDMALLRLEEMGKWLDKNGETIYGTVSGGFTQGESIVSTRRGNIIYLHILDSKINRVEMPVNRKVENVEIFANGEAVNFKNYRGHLRFNVDVPDDCPDYIVKVELK